MKNKRIILSGKDHYSRCIKVDENVDEVNEKPSSIHKYRVLMVSEDERIVASETTEDKLVVDYIDDHIAGVFRMVERDGKKEMVPFKGLFIAVWFEGKSAKKIRFVWSEMLENSYKYAGFTSYGIEQHIIMKLCDIIFSQLIAVVSSSLSERFKASEVEEYIDKQLIVEE